VNFSVVKALPPKTRICWGLWGWASAIVVLSRSSMWRLLEGEHQAVHLKDTDLGEGHRYHTRERITRLRGPVGLLLAAIGRGH
jgi:hypothetical protein